MALNVNTSVTDVFYRYKMPRLVAKVEGKGNGIKTVVVNMSDVAKALCRPPSYPCKYFGCELGAQTQMDSKNDRYIVNGAHDAAKLQEMLDGFIHKFVLCPSCDNPETVLQVREKKGVIGQSCKACGYQGMLDMRHKLTTFILKNPPDADPSAAGKAISKAKNKKGKKGKANGDDKGSDHSEDGDDQLEGWSTDVPAAKTELDEDWSVDVSEEAVQKRQAELTDGVKGLTINDDLEKAEKDRLEIFYRYVLERRDAGKLSGQEKSLVAEAERLDVRDKAPLVLSELLFNDTVINQISQHRVLLLRFTHDNKKAQKYLMGGMEMVINLYKDQLMPKVPHILKKLYDLDILEEEVLLEWAKKPSKKYVPREVSEEMHARAEQFVTWLREAEEESDSESDEDDVEITYDDRAREIKEEKKPAPAAAAPAAAPADEHDDLDIDDI